LILLFGVFRFLTNTQVNPVTGEKQHVALTVPQEIALGMQSAPAMAARLGGEVDPDSRSATLVREVGERLVAESTARRSEYRFQFHLLRDPNTVNAFALPGDQVFITVGLLSRLQNEAQLAGVLGHEIGHVIHRHGAQHLAKGEFGQSLVTAVGIASSDDRGSGRANQQVAAMVNSMVQLKYGRGDESQSDQFGLEAMTAAGFDPSQMLGVMKILSEVSKGNRQPEWLASHPYPEHRAEQIEAWLHRKYPDGIPELLTVGLKFKTR
jgi:predicted Zn-dependent protease